MIVSFLLYIIINYTMPIIICNNKLYYYRYNVFYKNNKFRLLNFYLNIIYIVYFIIIYIIIQLNNIMIVLLYCI